MIKSVFYLKVIRMLCYKMKLFVLQLLFYCILILHKYNIYINIININIIYLNIKYKEILSLGHIIFCFK